MNESPAAWPTQTAPHWQDWAANRIPSRIFGRSFATRRASPPAEDILSDAVGWWDVATFRDGDRFLRNRGTGQDLLDLRLGSSLAPNTNDPTYLPLAGTGYIYLSGAALSTLTCTAPATATQYAAYPLDNSAATTGAATGGVTFTFSTTGSWVRVDLLDVSNVVVASFDADNVGGGDTTYTDTYSVAWSFTRPAGNYKRTVVVPRKSNGGAPVFLCGLDDRLEIPIENRYQHQLLSVRKGEPFTLFIVARCWAIGGGQTLYNKGTANNVANNPSWYSRGGSNQWTHVVNSESDPVTSAPTVGTNIVGGKRLHGFTLTDRAIQAISSTVRGTAASTLELGNTYNSSSAFTICGGGGSNPDAEIFAAAIFRRALTNAEIATLTTYYGAV